MDIWYLTLIGSFMCEEWIRNCFSHIQNMQSHTRQWGWELLSQDFRRSPEKLCEFTMNTLQLPSANSEIFKATCWIKWWFAIGPYVHLEQQSLTLAVPRNHRGHSEDLVSSYGGWRLPWLQRLREDCGCIVALKLH